MIRLLEILFSGRAMICFRVSIIPPMLLDAGLRYKAGESNPIAPRPGFSAWALVQRPPPHVSA